MDDISLSEEESPKYNPSPTEAIERLKKGKSIYVGDWKVSSLKDLEILMKTHEDEPNKAKPE